MAESGDPIREESKDIKEPAAEEQANDSPAQELPSELEKQIIRQIEYYFGDFNLPRDKFLQAQIKLDDGWIPFEILFKFKRLASLTTDADVVIAALAKSPKKLLQVSEDHKKLRRDPEKKLPAYDDEKHNEIKSRTVYIKGFPTDCTLDKILEFLAPHGTVESVQMRRYSNKLNKTWHFKGSVFAVCQSKETAEKLVQQKDLKFGDQETNLIIKLQSVYFEDKAKERDERKKKVKPNTTQVKVEALPKGSIFRLSGIAPDTDLHDIKDALLEFGAKVAFITFKKDDKEAVVRLHGENSAQGILNKMNETKLVVKDAELTGTLVTGEEEEGILAKATEFIKAKGERITFQKSGRKGGRHQFSKQRDRNGRKPMSVHPVKVKMEENTPSNDADCERKRKAASAEEEPPAKQATTETSAE